MVAGFVMFLVGLLVGGLWYVGWWPDNSADRWVAAATYGSALAGLLAGLGTVAAVYIVFQTQREIRIAEASFRLATEPVVQVDFRVLNSATLPPKALDAFQDGMSRFGLGNTGEGSGGQLLAVVARNVQTAVSAFVFEMNVGIELSSNTATALTVTLPCESLAPQQECLMVLARIGGTTQSFEGRITHVTFRSWDDHRLFEEKWYGADLVDYAPGSPPRILYSGSVS